MNPTTADTFETSLEANTNPQPALTTCSSTSDALPQPQLIGSCVHCRRRKVRCDKQSPCGNCVRFGKECELAPRKRAPRRPRKPPEGAGFTARELELMKRLNSLEGETRKGTWRACRNQREKSDPISGLGTPWWRSSGWKSRGVAGYTGYTGYTFEDFGAKGGRTSGEGDGNSDVVRRRQNSIRAGQLLFAFDRRGQYFPSAHSTDRMLTWFQVDDLVQLFFDTYREDDEEVSLPETSSASTDQDHQSFVLGYASTKINMRDLHPLPSQLPFYLQIFSERVDVLVKILHIPSVEALFKEAQQDLSSLGRSTEALMFAIYFAVITSMTVDEVRASLGCERKVAQDRCRFGVEQALARANFLDTSDLTSLQAFVLYLAVVGCEDDNRVGWALMRSAVGVAQSMGLHRDGRMYKLSPFDVEMRRRLWWQLCVLDFRLSEKHGTETCTMNISFDTQRPLNVNDYDLHPEALVAPDPRDGLTDVSLTLISCEIASTAHSLLIARGDAIDGDLQVPGKEERIRKFCQVLEEKYVKYCTDSTSLSWIVSKFCNLVICKLEPILLLPLTRSESAKRDGESKELHDKMFLASVQVVELRRDLEHDIIKQWHWYLRTAIQWHAIAYLLSELCVREPDENVTRAWNVLDLVFQDHRDLQMHGAPGLIMTPMKKLIARARQKRSRDLERLRLSANTVQEAGDEIKAAVQAQLPACDIIQAQDFFPGTFDPQNIPNPQDQTYGEYQQDWLQRQQQQQHPTMAPTPWLLEDSALQDLGIDQNYPGPGLEWEGLNDLMSQIQPAYGSNPHDPFGW